MVASGDAIILITRGYKKKKIWTIGRAFSREGQYNTLPPYQRGCSKLWGLGVASWTLLCMVGEGRAMYMD